MKLIRTFFTFAAMALFAGCVATPEQVEQARLKAAEQVRLAQLARADIDSVKGDFIDACIAAVIGSPPDETRISTAPFRKVTNRGKDSYHGRWSGSYEAVLDLSLVNVSTGYCAITVSATGTFEGEAGAPPFELMSALNESGFIAEPYSKTTVGGSFVGAGLKALLPGPTYRDVKGTTRLKRGDKTYTLKSIILRYKEGQAPVVSFYEIE